MGIFTNFIAKFLMSREETKVDIQRAIDRSIDPSEGEDLLKLNEELDDLRPRIETHLERMRASYIRDYGVDPFEKDT
jgi:hypothetical protein